jgi:hypothetical protein
VLSYSHFDPSKWGGRVPKLNTRALITAFELAASKGKKLDHVLVTRPSKHTLYFKKTAYNWLTFCRKLPPCYDKNGKAIAHTKFDVIATASSAMRDAIFLTLNGKLQFSFWIAVGDDFDVTRWMFGDLPVDFTVLTEADFAQLAAHAEELEAAMKDAVSFKVNAGKRVGNYNLARCRHVTDRSDLILARAFGFDDVWEDIELLYSQVVRTVFGEGAGEDGDEGDE